MTCHVRLFEKFQMLKQLCLTCHGFVWYFAEELSTGHCGCPDRGIKESQRYFEMPPLCKPPQVSLPLEHYDAQIMILALRTLCLGMFLKLAKDSSRPAPLLFILSLLISIDNTKMNRFEDLLKFLQANPTPPSNKFDYEEWRR